MRLKFPAQTDYALIHVLKTPHQMPHYLIAYGRSYLAFSSLGFGNQGRMVACTFVLFKKNMKILLLCRPYYVLKSFPVMSLQNAQLIWVSFIKTKFRGIENLQS